MQRCREQPWTLSFLFKIKILIKTIITKFNFKKNTNGYIIGFFGRRPDAKPSKAKLITETHSLWSVGMYNEKAKALVYHFVRKKIIIQISPILLGSLACKEWGLWRIWGGGAPLVSLLRFLV